jgi:hypothetical protein
VSTVALVVGAAAPPAHAEASTAARSSWGTAKSANGRAQMVRSIVEVGGTAYLGGAFKTMVKQGGGSASRTFLAAVDGATGELTPWDPHPDGTVWAMALSFDGVSVYVGGDFSHARHRHRRGRPGLPPGGEGPGQGPGGRREPPVRRR